MIVTNPLRPGSWTREQIDNVSRGWWVLLVSGLVGVAAGGIILFTDWSVDDLALFIGAFLFVRGIITAFSVPVDGAVRGWAVALGIIEALVGVAALVWPEPTLLVIAFLIGWYVLFSGIMTVAGAISFRGLLPYWGLMLAFGILEIVFSFYLLNRPGVTLVAAVFALGIWAIIYGVIQIVLSFEIKNLPTHADEARRRLESITHPRTVGAATGN